MSDPFRPHAPDAPGTDSPSLLTLLDLEKRVKNLEEAFARQTEQLERLRPVPPKSPEPAAPRAAPVPAATPPNQPAPLPPWLLVEIWRDLVSMLAMFFDIRFKVAWSTRIVTLVLVPIILTTHLWFFGAYLPGIGGFLVNAVNLVLGFVLFKWLSRDARRYQEWKRR